MIPTPGTAHPEPPASVEQTAARLRVPLRTLRVWIDRGLPVESAGIDPFVALTWASWSGSEAPVVQARWRRYVAWATHPAARRPRRIVATRVHRCYLENAASGVWWQPPLAVDECQKTEGESWAPVQVEDVRSPLVREHVVHLTPVIRPVDPWLRAQVRAVAGEFLYGYRHHQVGETLDPQTRAAGTCIDAVVSLAARLAAGGRPWRIVAGISASDTYANPHWWVESDGVVLDPTLPAIARMAGLDWEAILDHACGVRDNRRIAFAAADPRLAHTTLGGLAGAVLIGGEDGFACTDWACGRCVWRF